MRRTAVLATSVAAVGVLALGGAAYGAPKTKMLINQGSTSGSYTLGGDGAATLTGAVGGDPFDGTYTATLAADDGSLPEPGECEAATATVRVDGSHKQYYVITGSGTVCGKWVDATYKVTHVFTGGYVVTDASTGALKRSDGWYSVRLATENRAAIEVVDS